MKIQEFLDHHHIDRNPFAEEDAQTDRVFKEHCIESTFHPNWDKVFGDPSDVATSIVFGEKGSGKTALRLQIARHVQQYNREHPDAKIFVIHYDDFNPFLDRFRARVGGRKVERTLTQWKLWDHMDAILSLGVTGLVDRILNTTPANSHLEAQIESGHTGRLQRHQARDLLLLAACYDQSTAETFKGRWQRVRKRLKFRTILAHADFGLAIAVNVLVLAVVVALLATGNADWLRPFWLYGAAAMLGWTPWAWRFCRRFWLARSIVRKMRVGNHAVAPLRQVLMHFTAAELASQPIPNQNRTDDRYELLCKFQDVLRSLGFDGVMVLVDRFDEPHLINGSAERMKAILWPMLDNKFLKQPGLGLKLMLPVELNGFIDRENPDFHQRARLDKQNMIRSFHWTAESLYDVANARIRACSPDGSAASLRRLIDDGVSDDRLMDTLKSLRVPRHLFKFMYRLLASHCNSHTDEAPVWTISPRTFESELAVYLHEQNSLGA